MLLINCQINLILTWSTTCVISNSATNQAITFAKTLCSSCTLSTDNTTIKIRF